MKTCPACDHPVKDHHERCVKCGAEVPSEPTSEPRSADAGVARRQLEKTRYLKEFVPTRTGVSTLLPHPTGWILGIGLPALLALAIVHAVLFPASADAKEDDAKKPDVSAVQKSQFKRCLRRARAKADLECAKITGTAEGLRRMTCTVARLSADYTRCTARLSGRFGRCLGRCGQAARSCSSQCAATAPQGWMDTAKCLMPCWKNRLQTCVSACFKPGNEPDPDPSQSAI